MPVYSYAYDGREYHPAMPIAELELISLAEGYPNIGLVGLIDSGADATMLPFEGLQSVGARYHRSRHMRGVTGQSEPVDTYVVTLSIGPYVIHGIEAVGMPDESEAILGRDVLNQLELTLNGPAQETWVA